MGLNQGLLTPALWTFGARFGGRPVHCKVLSSIPGLQILMPGAPPSCNNHKYPQTLPLGMGGQTALVETLWVKPA